MPTAIKSTCHQILREDGDKRISRLFKRLRRWSSKAFRKRHSPAAFRTCRNAGNSALTAEGTPSKGTGSISCEVEFCIFYRLSLRTLRTKDVYLHRSYVYCRYSCQILMKLEFSRHINKHPNTEFHEIPSSGSPVFPCGRTDGQTSGSHNSAKKRLKTKISLHDKRLSKLLLHWC
jgi:hypothetical protein